MRDILKSIVQRDDVKYVIGCKPGSHGWRVAPAFARTPEEVEEFIFSPLCVNNLATYLMMERRNPLPEAKKEAGKKVGIVAKGCDARAIGVILQEHGMARDDVIIVGVPCRGVIDPAKMQRKFGDVFERVTVEERDGAYLIAIGNALIEVAKAELLSETCAACRYPTPLLYDTLLGEPVDANPRPNAAVAELSAASVAERWAFWKTRFDRCVRCYACRNICPICNCEECMAEAFEPTWIRRSVNTSENAAYHIMRAFHIAGRCVTCGMCEKACPVGIPLTTLYQKVEQDALELFDYTAGINPDAEPLLSVFDVNDPDEGIL